MPGEDRELGKRFDAYEQILARNRDRRSALTPNQHESGFCRVTKICNWISERVEYLRGITTPTPQLSTLLPS